MKRITSLLLIMSAVLLPTLVSCDIEEKEPIETMYTGFMTGYTNSDGYIKSLKDDFGKQYTVIEESEKLDPNAKYRIVASLAVDEKLNARILQMAPTISYKAPEDSILADSLRVKDPVEINSLYIGGGFLNLYVGIKVAKEGTTHRLFYTHLDDTTKLRFTIYHNAYDDEPVYTKYTYISIPLSGYGLSQNDTVSLTAKGYQKDYAYELIYK
ncbi:MAG: hypothetical protein IKX55_05320 [Bacteroidaceae bacterium]|nr:hypothetical protein [Bacteroidaceae bacterium]